jgi:uncharacterized LabA/DUF88 family protein
MKRLAVLLDGGFVKRQLKRQLGRALEAKDFAAFVGAVVTHTSEYELFRCYYYDAPPFDGSAKHPISGQHLNFKKDESFRESGRLLDQMAHLPDFAVRLGECVMQGWEVDRGTIEAWSRLPPTASQVVTSEQVRPRIKQRGVDLRIGLDIAHLTNLRLVEAVCLVTGDSDFIPAVKYARRGGLRVLLHTMGSGVYPDLKKHADVVIG